MENVACQIKAAIKLLMNMGKSMENTKQYFSSSCHDFPSLFSRSLVVLCLTIKNENKNSTIWLSVHENVHAVLLIFSVMISVCVLSFIIKKSNFIH